MPPEDTTNAAVTPGADGEQPDITPGAGDGNTGAGSGGEALQFLTVEQLVKLIGDERKENAFTRKKLRDVEQAEADRQAAAKLAEEERLKKQGEFQTLAEQRAAKIAELEAQAAKVEALQQRIKVANDGVIAQIPEHMRPLIPKLEPDELSTWLAEHADKLKGKPAPELDAGKTGERGNNAGAMKDPVVRM